MADDPQAGGRAGPILLPLHAASQAVHPNSTPGPLPHLGGSLSKPPGNGDGSHATASTARVPTREGAREDALDDGAGLGWAGLPGARRAGPRGLEREGRELGHRGLL